MKFGRSLLRQLLLVSAGQPSVFSFLFCHLYVNDPEEGLWPWEISWQSGHMRRKKAYFTSNLRSSHAAIRDQVRECSYAASTLQLDLASGIFVMTGLQKKVVDFSPFMQIVELNVVRGNVRMESIDFNYSDIINDQRSSIPASLKWLKALCDEGRSVGRSRELHSSFICIAYKKCDSYGKLAGPMINCWPG